jgi:hypothetical protein
MRGLLVSLGLIVVTGWAAPAQAEPVAVELVLALDVSSSVDRQEYALQVQGLAAALRSAEVIAAIERAPGGIAVTVLQWSSRDDQEDAIPWTRLVDAADCRAVAARIERLDRAQIWGITALGAALRAAQARFAGNPFRGARRVIDLSGDGYANDGPPLADARLEVLAAGTTVNGLAILNERPDLVAYFAAELIGGPDSFVIEAADYHDFERAMRLKLVREIGSAGLVLRGAQQHALDAVWPRPAALRIASRRAVGRGLGGDRPRGTQAAHQQPEGDRHVQQVPADAVQEGGPIGAGEVVDLAAQPAAQRHADDGRHQHQADPGAGLAGREVVAHDHRVARHDAALRQPE